MGNIVINAENVSKQYRLGMVGTGTLSHDFKRWLYKMRGKEDPFLKVGDANDRTTKGTSDYVWALKDINFKVEQGEVLGIIGKNGAGKSTLLKILSRVTTPTTGSISVKGRMASLLEVGTGFHPELTGRENVFLNGAIMGMSKAEIKGKFDEIVDFSGVERYIDTPVKRYSSGMYVRLAFAVAAYLDPEILVIDEVLAVGDAEFQKKCIGKMKDVSGQGRTVLFVSHNMSSIRSICNKGLWIHQGGIKEYGEIEDTITSYLSQSEAQTEKSWSNEEAPGTDVIKLIHTRIFNPGSAVSALHIDKKLVLSYTFDSKITEDVEFTFSFCTEDGITIFACNYKFSLTKGENELEVSISENLLNDNYYTTIIQVFSISKRLLVRIDFPIIFKLDAFINNQEYLGKWGGLIRPEIEIKKL